jgi:endoglucanase
MPTKKDIKHRPEIVSGGATQRLLFVYIFIILFILIPPVFSVTTAIRLNSLGFQPERDKRACVVPPPAVTVTDFTVKREADNSVAYTATLTNTGTNVDTGEIVYVADFSSLSEQGNFYLDVPQVGTSYTFQISGHVYDDAYKTVMRGFYGWRCGSDVSITYGGNVFQHAACHLNDAYTDYIDSTHTQNDATGGWHDAGDYNKYVVNAGVTMGLLLFAWEHYQAQIQTIALGNPVTAPGYPEFLEELKWETDWLLKMQASDGTAYSKVSALSFCCDSIMPQYESESRYFVPYSTAATADLAAILAMASRNFAPYDAPYAAKCLSAAKAAYAYLTVNTANVYANQSAFSTGTYDTTDSDDRLWAAAELWETTGEAAFQTDFITKASAVYPKIEINMDWANVGNLGMITYLFSSRSGKNAVLVNQIRTDLISAADNMVSAGASNSYGRPAGSSYYWGSNGLTARQTLTLQTAYMLTGNSTYQNAALDAVGFLFGRNYFCRSFVTGLGFNPVTQPHHRPSTYDGITAPWPGYLVGGPNQSKGDPVLNAMASGLPAQQYWADNSNSYASNEVAINWNSALVYALAGFIYEPATPTPTPTITGTPPTQTVTPTITQTSTITPTYTISPTSTPVPTKVPVYVDISDYIPFPNPTKGDKVTFRYMLNGYADKVTLNIYTFGDRKIYSAVKTNVFSGVYDEVWYPTKRLANGIYYYTLEGINGTRPVSRHVDAFFVIR